MEKDDGREEVQNARTTPVRFNFVVAGAKTILSGY